MPTTAASFSLMIVLWWWLPMKAFSKTKDASLEINPEADPKCNLHSTLQCSRRTRVVPARSSDSTSLIKPLDPPTGISLIPTLEPPLLAATKYARCPHRSRPWVSIATISLDQEFPKPLSISVCKKAQSRTCTRGWETTRDPTARLQFPKPYSNKAANLIRWEEAQASCSKKQPQPLDKILDSEKWKHSECWGFII